MSYYHPSQTVAMTRGRGFSTSYRGSSSRGNSWGSERGRGNYSSSRGGAGGRFSSNFSNSFDSRSKYQGSSERYSESRGHSDDYRKSYRSELPSAYSGRDTGSHRSPERKRIRTEAPSTRRSHDGGYGESFNSSSRYEPSGGFSERRSFSRDHRPAPFTRREEFRKPSGLPPSSSPRGGYRGRISSRGSRGARLREGPPRRRLVESSYLIRKRLSTRSSDFARKLKMSRIRSAAVRRSSLKRSRSLEKEDSPSDKEDKKEEEEEEEEELPEKAKSIEKEKKDPIRKSPKKERKEPSSEKEEKKSESDHEEKSRRSSFIKLSCPHCLTRCITFNKYSIHLQSSRHMAAMRRVALKQKAVLARMRLAQRNAQRELEKTTDDLAPRTNFCPLCKLNYKQPKSTHQASEAHKNMKRFLMPFCKTCKITFKSPMLYETHLCSIEHIKRKARSDVNGEKQSDKEEASGNEEDNLENFMTIDSVGDVDDEEGEGKKKDPETKTKEPINVGIDQIRKVEVYYCDLCHMYLPRVDDQEAEKILSKHCKQRTHTQKYVRYREDRELAKRAEHLHRKETAEKEIREKEKEKEDQKNSSVSENEEKDKKKVKEIKEEDKDKSAHSAGDEEDGGDDKLWADVDKDLGDILAAEAESGNKSSDEDDDSRATGGRYDRFRYSEKAGEEKKVKKEDDAGKEIVTQEKVVVEKKSEEK